MNTPTRIAIIGAGSFTFGPPMLWQTLVEEKLEDVHLALIDLNASFTEQLQAIGERIAEEQKLSVTFSHHTEWAPGLQGADYVICAIDPGMMARYEKFLEISQRYYHRHIGTEYGGLLGIANSYAQVRMIKGVAEAMKQHCPHAQLLDSANPLTRVCMAAHRLGIQAIGFCMAGSEIYRLVHQLLTGEDVGYKMALPKKLYQAKTAGVNHFVWLLELLERKSGRDLLPDLKTAYEQGRRVYEALPNQFFAEKGYLVAPNAHHYIDFLGDIDPDFVQHGPWHGDQAGRDKRNQLFREIAAGERDWQEVEPYCHCWERPISFIKAQQSAEKTYFAALNLPNDNGQIPNLPRNIYVETPAWVSSAGIEPETCQLPEAVLPEQERAARIHDLLVSASLEKDRNKFYAAAELDPFFSDAATDRQAIDSMLDYLEATVIW